MNPARFRPSGNELAMRHPEAPPRPSAHRRVEGLLMQAKVGSADAIKAFNGGNRAVDLGRCNPDGPEPPVKNPNIVEGFSTGKFDCRHAKPPEGNRVVTDHPDNGTVTLLVPAPADFV